MRDDNSSDFELVDYIPEKPIKKQLPVKIDERVIEESKRCADALGISLARFVEVSLKNAVILAKN